MKILAALFVSCLLMGCAAHDPCSDYALQRHFERERHSPGYMFGALGGLAVGLSDSDNIKADLAACRAAR